MDRVPIVRIRELCRVKKGQDKRIQESVLRGPRHMERIAKRAYVGECASSRSVSRPRKIWIDNVKEGLNKRGLDVRQPRTMV